MADVIEVIHKINYEVNDADLNRVTDVIRLQISEINRLTGVLRDYQRQLNSTREISALADLSKKIDGVSRQIEAIIAQTKSSLLGLKDSVIKGLGLDLETSIGHVLAPIKNALYQVGEEGKNAGLSIASIGNSLFSLSGGLPGIISLVASLAIEFFNASNNAEKAATNISDMTTAIKTQVDAKSESTELEANRLNQGVNAARRNLELQRAKGASDETILNAELELNAQKARATENKAGSYDYIISSVTAANEQFSKASKHLGYTRPGYVDEKLKNAYIKDISKKLQETYKITEEEAKTQAIAFFDTRNTKDSLLASLNSERTKIREDIKDIANEREVILAEYDRRQEEKEKYEARKKEVERKFKNQETKSKDDKPLNIDDGIERPKVEIEPLKYVDNTIEPLKEIAVPEFPTGDIDKRAEQIEKLKETYKTLAQTAADAFNTIYEAQIKSLDKEIDVRKDRVAKATELAKKGETDQLQAEQDRLDKATEARDAAAKKQMQINALVQVSNQALALTEAIGAVVSAASKGDPYTIAFRVAAAVAALVAGIAAISSAFGQANGGFAEGGYTGHGGKYQPAGIVHKGEFVMDAENTKRYRPLLEAMHSGVFPMPLFKQPEGINTQYASRKEMAGVEKKLDALIGAVEASQTKVNARVDERGVAIITQRYQKTERRKWS